jgi:hypothetical protein
VLDRPSLFRVELFEIGDGHGLRINTGMDVCMKHVSAFTQNAFAATFSPSSSCFRIRREPKVPRSSTTAILRVKAFAAKSFAK